MDNIFYWAGNSNIKCLATTNFVVKPRNINEEELRKAVLEIDALFSEKNCLEAISVSRMLLATLKASPNWNKLRNGGCGAFFRATKACMDDLQTRLYSGIFSFLILSISCSESLPYPSIISKSIFIFARGHGSKCNLISFFYQPDQRTSLIRTRSKLLYPVVYL